MPPPLGGDFLGVDYRLFGRAIAKHFFGGPKQILSYFLRIGPFPLKNPRNATGVPYIVCIVDKNENLKQNCSM